MAHKGKKRISKKRRTQYLEMKVDGLLHGPEAVGRVNGRAIFVPRAVPGDELKVKVTEKKKTFWRAEIVNVLTPSPHRRKPPCHVFGRCGGCQWLHVDYDKQVEAKTTNVLQTMKRIGRQEISDDQIEETYKSPRKYHYRFRARLRCRVVAPGILAVGFRGAGSHRVVSHDDCWIYSPTIRRALYTAGRKMGRDLLDRTFTCHAALSTGEKPITALAIEVKEPELIAPLEAAFKAASAHLPLRYHIQSWETGECVSSQEPAHISYEVPSADGSKITLKAAARSFFQANLISNEELISTLIRWADVSADDTILDLYSGVGNLSLPLICKSKKVVAVEQNELCVALSKENAKDMGDKYEIREGEAEEICKKLADEEKQFSLALLDPPREGARELIPSLRKLAPEKILYVSCDPATLARDVAALVDEDLYELKRLRVFDLFPQTYHVETVVELVKKAKA